MFIKMKKILVLSALIVLVSACKTKQDKGTVVNNTTRAVPVEIGILAQNGQSPDLSKYKGKFIFINFWATWCKPCVQEMPSLQHMTENLKGENIVFLFASDESKEDIADFKASGNYSMDFVKTESLANLNISAIPTTFIFNTNGELVFSETGARQWDSEESIALIKQVIKKQ